MYIATITPRGLGPGVLPEKRAARDPSHMGVVSVLLEAAPVSAPPNGSEA
jgi:hypothetical protein